MSITNAELVNYFHFMALALRGGLYNYDEKFLEYKKDILSSAKYYETFHKGGNQKIYRGIILEKNQKGDVLLNIPHITCVSFSTDKKVAEDFADIDSEMSQVFNKNTHEGYLINSETKNEVIVFHWEWLQYFNKDVIEYLGGEEVVNLINSQKEVLVTVHDKSEFKITKFKR